MPNIRNTCIEGVMLALIITFQGNFVHNIELPASACKESISTVQAVYVCPVNKKGHDAASMRKSCRNTHNMCTSFEYHCVLNEWLNGTVEVCAPSIYIQSRKCAMFIAELQSIRVSYSTNCKTCPIVYNSSEIYKYPECYDEVRGSLTSVHPSTMMMTETTLYPNTTPHLNVTQTPTTGDYIHPGDDDDDSEAAVVCVVLVVIGLLILGVIVAVFIRKRIYSRLFRCTCACKTKGKTTTQESAYRTDEQLSLQALGTSEEV